MELKEEMAFHGITQVHVDKLLDATATAPGLHQEAQDYSVRRVKEVLTQFGTDLSDWSDEDLAGTDLACDYYYKYLHNIMAASMLRGSPYLIDNAYNP